MRGALIVLVIVAMFDVSGCSSTSAKGSRYEVDADKVGVVNAIARQRGIDVIWVNPPMKEVDASAQNPKRP